MKKVIKLTESQLTNIIKKVVIEQMQSEQSMDLNTIKNLFKSKGYVFSQNDGYKLWGHKETSGPIKGKDGKYVWNYEVYIPLKGGNQLWIDKRRKNEMGGTESENIIINLNGPKHMIKQVKNGKTIGSSNLDFNGVSELIKNYVTSF
jgi:hypothetical protein